MIFLRTTNLKFPVRMHHRNKMALAYREISSLSMDTNLSFYLLAIVVALEFLRPLLSHVCVVQVMDDQTLGFIANFVGVFVFALVIAYHYVVAEARYEGN
ncbi:hypothetical protein Droror1_Dr00016923 [Drosera rotundifolia]